MKDERFDAQFEALMRDAARSYNRPPDLADADATWQAIERALPTAARGTPDLRLAGDAATDAATAPHRPRPARSVWTHPWARMAAMLLVGVAIGRITSGGDARVVEVARGAGSTMRALPVPATTVDAAGPDEAATREYLTRTQALLAGLPAELLAQHNDAAFLSQADALLLQTRLLLDSPVAADPALRSLLDDLEIVLAQVVRLDARRDPMDVDFLHQALEQRDVLPRLRDAVIDKAAD